MTKDKAVEGNSPLFNSPRPPPLAGGDDVTIPYTENHNTRANCTRHIAVKLVRLNDLLQALEQDVIKFRAAIRREELDEGLSPKDVVAAEWWTREVTKAMKIYHWYTNFNIRVLCDTFCDHA